MSDETEPPKPGIQSSEMDPANLRYEGEVCIYTDPESKYEYKWDTTSEKWIPFGSNSATPTAPVFDGESYTYTSNGSTFKWDTTRNDWVLKSNPEQPKVKMIPSHKNDDDIEEHDTDDEEEIKKNEIRQDMKSGQYGYDGENHTYTDPKDGAVYFWDKEKNAWFPKVDDDFMARYQMSYGFVEQPQTQDAPKVVEEKKKQTSDELKRKQQEPQWFEQDDKNNTKVYVSNLPLDITEQEFVDLMQKCGLVMRDVDTGNMKIKLYHEAGNPKQLKGDGLCTYIKIESVDLALNLLDGYLYREHRLKVERAKFELKGAYDPTKKPKKRRRKDKEKIKKAQEKLFDWRPDKMRGERSKHERTVIIKNLFDPEIFDTDVGLILEYQQDLREEGSKCGDVRKVIIYDRHKDGVAQMTFRSPEEADACVTLFNNRWFNKRQITAETWDGKTKYRIMESAEETEARLAKWTKYLEAEEGKKSALEANHNAGLAGKEETNDDSDEDNECENSNENSGAEKKGTEKEPDAANE